MTSTVLILGARGRFGLAATRAFAQAGWQVLAQVRPGKADQLASIPHVRRIELPLDDAEGLAAAAAGAQVVVHALNPAYTFKAWTTEAPQMLEQAIALSRRLQACLMLPGNVYNYGEQMPERLAEDTPQRAGTVKGRARIAMERRLQAACADGQMRAVVVRAGDFFGCGAGSWLDRTLVPQLPKGKMGYPGPLDVPTAWSYLPDLAQSFVAVAARRAELPAFDSFNFGGYQLSGRDWEQVLTQIAHEQGWLAADTRLKMGGLPWGLIRIGALVVPLWGSLLEMRYLWLRAHGLDNSKLRALIGAEPHRPLADAVRAALADLKMLPVPAAPAALAAPALAQTPRARSA